VPQETRVARPGLGPSPQDLQRPAKEPESSPDSESEPGTESHWQRTPAAAAALRRRRGRAAQVLSTATGSSGDPGEPYMLKDTLLVIIINKV